MSGNHAPIRPERNVAKWRELYAKKYGREPPKRIEALKRFNQAAIKRRRKNGEGKKP